MLLAVSVLCYAVEAQTTAGLIAGRVTDKSTGVPIARAKVVLTSSFGEVARSVSTGSDGNYFFPETSPGDYRLTVTGNNYQPLEIDELHLSVAGYLDADFELRPLSDVWERGRYRSRVFQNKTVLNFFGPDVDPAFSGNFEPAGTLTGQFEPSVSEVIDLPLIDSLPLNGRDVYTAIVLLPGVTSDTATVRSIGLSANGQRPTSSNFLLDGVDNNNHVLTGPQLTLAPEAVGEYRVSTNNFSAEYGGVSGYVANAITREAGTTWHGTLYSNWKNSVFNANTFNRNTNGLPKLPEGDVETGYQAGGRLPWRRWRLMSTLDYFHAHSNQDAQTAVLPTLGFYNSLPANSFARQLLHDYPPRFWAPGSESSTGQVSYQPPLELTRWTALERGDFQPASDEQLQLRVAASSLENPTFNWSPYGQAPFRQSTIGGAVVWNRAWTSALTTTVRTGVHFDRLNWGLANQELAIFSVSGGGPELPGAFGGKAYDDRSHTVSIEGGSGWIRGRNMLKAGGGWSQTGMRDRFLYEPEGVFYFADLSSFVSNQAAQYESVLSRTGNAQGLFQAAPLRGLHAYQRAYGYLQEDLRLRPDVTLNAGLRIEHFGAPVANETTPDTVLVLPPQVPPSAGINSAQLSRSTHPFDTNTWLWAPRFALAYAPRVASRSVILRAGYGIFHDVLYDNLWSSVITNDALISTFDAARCSIVASYQRVPVGSLPANCLIGTSNFLNPVSFRSPLTIPTLQSFFVGFEAPLAPGWLLAVNGLGSSARYLISTDVLNRLNENQSLPAVYYRANDARSNYAALTISARYQGERTALRAFYTWSHSIDNQSDPLLGDFFDLGFSNQTDRVGVHYYGAFTNPNDYNSDRGNSDFDQRHNFALFGYWQTPEAGRLAGLTRNWRLSGIFVARSGLPYSVYAGSQSCEPICNTRANLINPGILYKDLNQLVVPGGRQLLNPAAFAPPPEDQNGNSGRNAFGGPGFWNVDLSVGRDFAVRRLGENVRLTVRADAFNVLNHANLQPPDAYWGVTVSKPNPTFGSALFGRTQKAGFPAVTR